MSTTAQASVSARSTPLASSSAFRTFATTFAIATPVLYVLCDMQNWPVFTYYPATDRVDFGWAPAVKDEGPAMYWYGWAASTFLGAGALGLLATMLPESISKKMPLSLVWIAPLLALPVLIYSLKFFWRW